VREKLTDLVRRVVSGSVLFTGASTSLPAIAVPGIERIPLPGPEASGASNAEIVVRESRPRLILKRTADAIVELISSHRSHRSHSSHRSHYSSSGAPSRPTAPTRPSGDTGLQKAGLVSGPSLGSRMLVLGMKGADVLELMRLLTAHQYLTREAMSRDSSFTKEVEKAVKMFQIAQGLDPDGKVGPTVTLLLKRPP